MDLTGVLIRLPNGEVIPSTGHDVMADIIQVKIDNTTIMDDRHLSLIYDGKVLALMAVWRLEEGILILTECHRPECFCHVARVLSSSALLAESDNTLPGE